MANDFNMRVGAILDIDSTKMQSDLNKQAKNVKLNLEIDKQSFNNRISQFISNNPKLTSDIKKQLTDVQGLIKDVDKTELNTLKKSFRSITSEAQLLGRTGDTVFSRLQKNTAQFVNFLASGTLIMSGVNSIREMISNVYELDTAMTSLRKVTDETDATYNKFLDNASSRAQTLGRSISSLISQTAEWAKLGYNVSDASKLAEVSSIYANVGEVDDTTAVSDLVSTMKAFNITASDSIKIVDSLNNLENKYAVSASGLGEGLKNSASALALAGNDMYETLALLTGGGEITQNVGELGNMLKVSSLRLAAMKGELEKIGEEYENINSVSKNQTQIYNLTKGQVNILDEQNNKLKNTYSILKEVAGAWNDVEELDKSTLLELMFGKQRANQGAAIINAFQSGQIDKALADAIDSQNSAYQEQEKWLNSLQAKTQQFGAAVEGLSSTIVSSDGLKALVDFGTGGVNALNALIEKTGLTGIALASLLGIVGTKSGAFKLLADQISLAMVAQTGYTAETSAAAFAQVGFTGAIKASTMAIKSFLLTNPVGWAILATTAIGGLVIAYDHFNVSLEEHQEKLSELKGNYDTITSEVESLESQLKTVQDKMKELEEAKPLDFIEDTEYKKLSDSNDQLERRLTIQKELQRIAGRDAEKEAIDTISTKSEQSLTKTVDSMSNSGYSRPAEITRDEAIRERINAYNELGKEIDKIENKQLQLAQSGETESNEYKKLSDQLEKINGKRDEYYDYIVTTMDALDTESDSIVGATTTGTEYANIISTLGAEVDNFIKSTDSSSTSLDTTASSVDDVASSATTATQEVISLSDALTALTKDNKLLSSVKDEIKEIGTISTDTANDILGTYPELESAVQDYLSGKIDEKELLEQMSDAYQTDYDNYVNSVLGKQTIDEDFYTNILSNMDDSITALASKYGIDLQNYANYQAAKLALDKEYQASVQAAQATQTLNDALNMKSGLPGSYLEGSVESAVQGLADQKTIDIESIIGEMNSVVDSYVKQYTSSPSSSTNKKSSSSTVDLPDAYEAERAKLEHEHAMGVKSDAEYYTELLSLKDKYLKDNKKYQDEIWSVEETVYSGRKQLHEKAIDDYRTEVESWIAEYQHRLDTGKITEEEYYKYLEYINKKYYKGKTDYLAEYQKHEEEIYSHSQEKAEQSTENFRTTVEGWLSEYKHRLETGQITEEQYYKYLNYINEKYYKGKAEYLDDYQQHEEEYYSWSKDQAEDLFDTMTEALDSSLSDVLDDMSDAYDKQTESINDAYEKLISAQKESLQAQKEANDYADSIADKNENISDIQSRISELQLAANSGDREAQTEIKSLQEELADAQEDLDDTVADHQLELQEDALDASLEFYKTITDQQLEDAKTVYDTKVEQVKALYEQEKKLIEEASKYTETEFSSAFTSLTTQINDVITQFNTATGSNVGGISPDTTKDVVDAQAGIASDSSNTSSISSVLKKYTGSTPQTAETALNKEIISKGYTKLTWSEMAQLASDLGMSGVSSTDVAKDASIRTDILTKLKKAGFKTGGKPISSGVTYSEALNTTGEKYLIGINPGESILDENRTKLLESINANAGLPAVEKMLSNLASYTGNVANYTTTNNNTPTVSINFDSLLSGITVSSDYDLLAGVKQNASKITQIVAKELKGLM